MSTEELITLIVAIVIGFILFKILRSITKVAIIGLLIAGVYTYTSEDQREALFDRIKSISSKTKKIANEQILKVTKDIKRLNDS